MKFLALRGRHDREGLPFGLNAVYGLLHRRIEILNAEADTVESELAKHRHVALVHGSRVDFDRVLAAVVVAKAKMTPGGVHQLAHLFDRKEGRRSAAPMQLLHRALAVEQRRLQRQLL